MRRFGVPLEPSLDAPFCFAQRALCAARILARPFALNLRLRRGLVAPSLYSPANAASAAFSPFNCRVSLSRSAFNSATMFIVQFLQRIVIAEQSASWVGTTC